MSTQTFNLNTNNSIYNCVVLDNKTDIEFKLPYGMPNQADYILAAAKYSKKDVVLFAAEQIRIKIYLTVLSKEAPSVSITSDSKVPVYGGDVKIEPEAVQLLSFVSSDGGNTWNVVNNVYGKVDTDAKLNALDEKLTEMIEAETDRATDAEDGITTALNSEINRSTKADSTHEKAIETNADNINKEVEDRTKAVNDLTAQITALNQNKVEKVEGKGLSTNDYTHADQEKVNTINLATE